MIAPTWQRDGVTLYLGDCLDVLRALPEEDHANDWFWPIDAVVTDPPFGIGFEYANGRETADPQVYWANLAPIVKESRRVSRRGAFHAWWQATLHLRYAWEWFGNGIRIYICGKNFVQLRKTPINYAYDPVVMWYEDGEPLCPATPKRNLDFFVANTAAVVSDPSRPERQHPCPRPLDAVSEIVGNFTLPGGTVLDPFMGSGTMGVACIQTGRKFIGIEIEPRYFEIAVKRIEQAMLQMRMPL